MNKLPDKPSELLLLSLDALLKVQADPNFKLHMGYYAKPWADGVCLVCHAGAIMAKSLPKGKFKKFLSLNVGTSNSNLSMVYDSDTCKKLLSLDYFRNGFISAFLIESTKNGRYHKKVNNLLLNYTELPFAPVSTKWELANAINWYDMDVRLSALLISVKDLKDYFNFIHDFAIFLQGEGL